MSLRTLRYALWIAVAIAGIALGALLMWPAGPGVGYGEPFGGRFTLVDHTGEEITDAAWRGQPSLVFFGFTHCPEVCPTTLYEMDVWLRALGEGGEAIGAFFVTVDPERDTPAVLGEYVTSVTDRVTGVSGAPERVSAFLEQAGIYASRVPAGNGDYTMDHTASVFMLDSAGRLVGTISYGESADAAVAKVKRLAGAS